MPRNPRTPEAGILKFFQTADYAVAKLMLGLIQSTMKDRGQSERGSLPKAEPVKRTRARPATAAEVAAVHTLPV